eukprot:UN07195
MLIITRLILLSLQSQKEEQKFQIFFLSLTIKIDILYIIQTTNTLCLSFLILTILRLTCWWYILCA